MQGQIKLDPAILAQKVKVKVIKSRSLLGSTILTDNLHQLVISHCST